MLTEQQKECISPIYTFVKEYPDCLIHGELKNEDEFHIYGYSEEADIKGWLLCTIRTNDNQIASEVIDAAVELVKIEEGYALGC